MKFSFPRLLGFKPKNIPSGPTLIDSNNYLGARIEYGSTLNDLNAAIDSASRKFKPLTYYLQDIYNKACLDPIVLQSMNARLNRVVYKEYSWSSENTNLPDIFNEEWFMKLCRMCMESLFYWYSPIFIRYDENTGQIIDAESFDRRNVVLNYRTGEHGIISNYQIYDEGDITAFSQYPDDIMLPMLGDNLDTICGLLHPLSAVLARKRELVNLLVEAVRKDTRPVYTLKSKIASQDNAKIIATEAMKNGFINIGQDSDYYVVEGNKRGFQPNLETINLLDVYIQLTVQGQTLTSSKSGSGSYSLAIIQERTLNNIVKADCKKILAYLNAHFLPILRRRGYNIPDNERIIIKNLYGEEDRQSIAKIFAQNMSLDPEFVKKEYGLDIKYPERPVNMPGENSSST